jgi:transposase-like protein
MVKKRHKAQEIIRKLRDAGALLALSKPVAEVSRALGVTDVTYYRWRKEWGGLKVEQTKRLKELEHREK